LHGRRFHERCCAAAIDAPAKLRLLQLLKAGLDYSKYKVGDPIRRHDNSEDNGELMDIDEDDVHDDNDQEDDSEDLHYEIFQLEAMTENQVKQQIVQTEEWLKNHITRLSTMADAPPPSFAHHEQYGTGPSCPAECLTDDLLTEKTLEYGEQRCKEEYFPKLVEYLRSGKETWDKDQLKRGRSAYDSYLKSPVCTLDYLQSLLIHAGEGNSKGFISKSKPWAIAKIKEYYPNATALKQAIISSGVTKDNCKRIVDEHKHALSREREIRRAGDISSDDDADDDEGHEDDADHLIRQPEFAGEKRNDIQDLDEGESVGKRKKRDVKSHRMLEAQESQKMMKKVLKEAEAEKILQKHVRSALRKAMNNNKTLCIPCARQYKNECDCSIHHTA